MNNNDYNEQAHAPGITEHELSLQQPNPEPASQLPPEMYVVTDESIEEIPDFPIDDFQVVRNQYIAHSREPSISFKAGVMNVNSACLKMLPLVDYAQILVNPETKTLAVRPCQESDVYSFQWCSYRRKDNKRSPRFVTCRILFLKLCELMGWDPEFKYKLIGKLKKSNGRFLFAFNLEEPDTFIYEKVEGSDKKRYSRTPVYPAEWQHQFGIPFSQSENALQVSTLNGYEMYVVKEKGNGESMPPIPVEPASAAEPSPNPYMGGATGNGY